METSEPTELVIYEVWGDVDLGIGTCISTQEGIAVMKGRGLMSDHESPLYSLRAASWTEVMTYHHEHNGWEPYKPLQ